MKSTVLPDSFLRRMDPAERKRMGKNARTCAEFIAAFEKKTERELQRDIATFLRMRDIWIGVSKFGKRTTFTPDAPDFLFVWRSMPFAFEVKIGKEEPSQAQLDCHAQMRRNGWLVFVVRSVEEVMEFLDGGAH